MFSPPVAFAMLGLIPAALLLVAWLRPLRGITAVFVLGWLLLPNGMYKISMLPPYDKQAAVSLAALVAMVALDSGRLFTFRPRWMDIPMFVWWLCPSMSSLANGLGPQDAVAVLLEQTLDWGIPYLAGRLYFGTPDAIGVLARGIVLGGILYVPLCLYEMKMSPVLHHTFYGFTQHQFLQSIRDGGYRPMVFMQHGLAVAFFMTAAAFVCVCLWRRRAAHRFVGMPIVWVAGTLVVVAFFCKSAGAMALLVIGVLVLWGTWMIRSRLPLIALLVIAPMYMSLRATGTWDGQSLVEIVRPISRDRADSLQCRVTSENVLGAHALQKPLLGWAGWGRSYNTTGSSENVIADGFWIIVLGKYGIVGLVALTSTLLLPSLIVLLRMPRALFFSPRGAPSMALCVLLILFTIDCLFNAMLNPMFTLAVGGLAGIGTLSLRPPLRIARPPARPARRAGVAEALPLGAAPPAIETPAPGSSAVATDPPPPGGAEGTVPR